MAEANSDEPAPRGSCLLYSTSRRPPGLADKIGGAGGLPGISRFDGHQRAFVKVQDGCDAFCSYCIVPRVRSRVWSRSADEIADECEGLRGGSESIKEHIRVACLSSLLASVTSSGQPIGLDKIAEVLTLVNLA